MKQFILFQSESNNRWYWRLSAANGESILKTPQSNGFASVSAAQEEITAVREAITAHLRGRQTVERFIGADKQQHFRLTAADSHDIIGQSEAYRNNAGRNKAIDALLASASAEVFVKSV